MYEIATLITAILAVSTLVGIALLLCLYLLSNWVMKPIDLSTTKTGHVGLDEAQRQFEALDLELGIMEDLDGNPDTLNELSDKLAIAKTARDVEQKNFQYQQTLEESREHAEQTVPVPETVQKITN